MPTTAIRSPLGPLTKAVQTSIGLAAELQTASKEREASEVIKETIMCNDVTVKVLLVGKGIVRSAQSPDDL